MANEIKYLSYDGLDYFWNQKLKPIIEENEEVITTTLVNFDDRLNTHTHMYVASSGYSASAARATYAASAGYAATAARSVTAATALYSGSAGYSASAARATYSASAGYSASAARATYAATAAIAGSILSNGHISNISALNGIPVINSLRYNTYEETDDTGLGFTSEDGMVLTACFSSANYASQLALDDNGYNIAFRYKTSSTWSDWKKLAFVDGTGVTGTWGISITGNAASAGYSASAARATYAASAGYSASAARATYAATAAYSASAGYIATAANAVTSANSIYSASAGYSASAARATYSASAGYVYRVNLLGSNSSVYYPMVFTSARTATVGALLYVDSGVTDTTSTATGIRYNPSLNRCYCSGGFYEASDDRLKNFGDDIKVDLDKLSQLSKKYFTWKDDKSNVQQIGVSAQEIQKLYPEIVNIVDEDEHLSVSYDKLSVIALKGIDILNNKVKSLEERITKLEKLIDIE